MEEKIIMSRSEYQAIESKIQERVKDELDLKYLKFPWFTFIATMILYILILPNVWEGYSYLPTLTLVTVFISFIFFMGLMFYFFLSIKKHYTLIYGKL